MASVREVRLTYGRRRKMPDPIRCSRDVVKAAEVLGLRVETTEHVYMIGLNHRSTPLAWYLCAKGDGMSARADVKEALRVLILQGATKAVLLHNHPSGDVSPSFEDIAFTKRMKEVLDLFEIELLDHVIIGDQSNFSFVDNNLMA